MTTDQILYDVLCTLYPDVGFETEAVVILTVLVVLGIASFAAACLLVWLDDSTNVSAEVFMGASVLLLILGIAFHSDTLDDKKDRLVRELVNDPAALPVVLEIKEDLEWVKDPRIQRNARGLK